MFGMDLFPRVTASLLTAAMVMGGGLIVLRRLRTDDRFTLRAWLGLEMDSFSPTKEKGTKSSKDLPEALANDYALSKIDPGVRDLIEQVMKNRINSQQVAAILDLLRKSEPKQKKKRHCNGVVKKKEEMKYQEQETDLKAAVSDLQETEVIYSEQEVSSLKEANVRVSPEQQLRQKDAIASSEQQLQQKDVTASPEQQKDVTAVLENEAKYFEYEIVDLKVTVAALKKENEELKQTVAKLVQSEDSWKEQVRVLYIQLAAVSKYAAQLRRAIEKSKGSNKPAQSMDSITFQCQVETHHELQKVNITSS